MPTRSVNAWLPTTGGAFGSNYHIPIDQNGLSQTITPSTNYIYATPFFNPRTDGIVSSLSVSYASNSTSGVKARLGLYAQTSNADLYPNALIADSGELSIATSTSASLTMTGSWNITGCLWAVLQTGIVVSYTISTGQAVSSDRDHYTIFGVADDFTTPQSSLVVPSAYGALPGVFPAGAGIFPTILNTQASIQFKITWSG